MDKLIKTLLLSIMILNFTILPSTNIAAQSTLEQYSLTPYASYGLYYMKYSLSGTNVNSEVKCDGNSFKLGAQIEMSINDNISFTPGIEFQHSIYELSSHDIANNFINIPLIVNYYFQGGINGIYAGLGPKFSLTISEDKLDIASRKTLGIAGLLTIGLQMQNGLRVALVGDLTLSNIYDIEAITGRNSFAGILVGYRL